MTTLLLSRTTHKVLSKTSGKALYSTSVAPTRASALSSFNNHHTHVHVCTRLPPALPKPSPPSIGPFSPSIRHLSTSIPSKHQHHCCGGGCKSTSSPKDPNLRQTTTIISTTSLSDLNTQSTTTTDTMSPSALATPFSLPTHAKTPARHLLSIADLTPKELQWLVDEAARVKKEIKAGIPPSDAPLKGKTVAMMFSKRSTRTRVSTEGAVVYLGGHPMFLGKDDIQLGVNESLYDTSVVISSMVSCMVARVGPHSDITGLADASSVPVINALSDSFHPFQAVTDLLTIQEQFPPGESPLGGKKSPVRIAWVGDANNVLYDLAIAAGKVGYDVAIATPKGYEVDPDMLELARKCADETGAKIEVGHSPEAAVKGADIIVTDTWVSMGQESAKAQKIKDFAGFQVTSELAARGGANPGWKFMHCLPRKPEEVSDEVFYSDRSVVFEEAENRLYAAIAVLRGFVVNKGVFGQ
ncbi:ornithine carbamoyltransferase [Ascobolus immersus RN42]|uniref:Ornithine carbamoyltransferase, mitochondrial n=1 Tax=Ascobolus immersus RN42 TaxID=1160509 RepID=A0A3N4I4T4_ASCIM|nr:ornithine carbamoyltransferase [Ascobolus immersus RN42]